MLFTFINVNSFGDNKNYPKSFVSNEKFKQRNHAVNKVVNNSEGKVDVLDVEPKTSNGKPGMRVKIIENGKVKFVDVDSKSE